jgi:hypothetical protein
MAGIVVRNLFETCPIGVRLLSDSIRKNVRRCAVGRFFPRSRLPTKSGAFPSGVPLSAARHLV